MWFDAEHASRNYCMPTVPNGDAAGRDEDVFLAAPSVSSLELTINNRTNTATTTTKAHYHYGQVIVLRVRVGKYPWSFTKP